MKIKKAPADMTENLKSVLIRYKAKPYLPFWGELFVITQELKTYAKQVDTNVHFYSSFGSSPILYLSDKDSFLVQAKGLSIKLSQHAFIDSLIAGRFWPNDI
ncbi:hypothetical protein L2D08_19380 [Domibacillus sp. PGB-M46]|uniref:hypothetical protein n=1 Tax=Domibacillus sp. PGB-M46 TaxID=2910255 RepID=UPI001F5AFF0F|nr:hypothetical protein [Domibacillus sp. PGB-M46]MCI2256505.1 hypothetical protein [Domibacillus sp. PGB-M46]